MRGGLKCHSWSHIISTVILPHFLRLVKGAQVYTKAVTDEQYRVCS